MFCPKEVDVARYAALIQVKSPTNYEAHFAESIFQNVLKYIENQSIKVKNLGRERKQWKKI